MNFYSNWSEVNKLVDQALGLEKKDRVDFLEKQCVGEPVLLEDAKNFLSYIEQAEDDETFFLSNTITDSGLFKQLKTEGFLEEKRQPAIGQRIGHYKITRSLGEGGMGTVFLAERDDGEFEQQVAIKFLRGYYSPTMRDRFRREKQMLARLNHPNIAGLLNGGITDEGTPYMIMEYVEGLPVDDYCKKHSLKLSERLKLFLTICQAVQHAHSKLIIHRDLKPDNILIDNDGQVKVMDFGIGKFLNSELDDESLLQTREGYHVASVEFAAPEQFRSGEPSTATDVYGLGVLLYFLLTGEKPFVFKGKSLAKIENILQNESPPQPSHHSNPAIGAIFHDLESIIMKALRKEPEQRYETVLEFSDDLRRFISHEPVVARKGSMLYKTKKFFYRNRAVLATAFIILIFATGFLSYHLQEVNRHIEQTEMEAETASSVTDFIVELFDVSDPIENEEGILTASALLERGQNRFDDLDINPEVQLELLSTLGSASMRLGNYVNAERIYYKADSIARSHFSEDNYQRARAALNLGNILTSHRKFFEGEKYLIMALPFISHHSDQYWQEHSQLLLWLGICLLNTKREDPALQVFTQALEIEQQFRPESRQALDVQLHLANAYSSLGDLESAESIYYEVLEKIEELGYSRYDIHRSVLNSLGLFHFERGDYRLAEEFFKTALEEAISIYGELHPNSLSLKSNLMYLYVYQNDFERAVSAGYDMLDAKIARHGQNSNMTADGHSALGIIHYAGGDYENSTLHFNKSFSIYEDLLGSNHHWTVNQKIYTALTLIESGRESEGNEMFNAALSVFNSPDFKYDYFAAENLRNYSSHFKRKAHPSLHSYFEIIDDLTS